MTKEANTSQTKDTIHTPKQTHNHKSNTQELSKYFLNEFHQIEQIKRYNRSEGKNKTYVEDLKLKKDKLSTFVKLEPYILEIHHNKEPQIKLWNKTLQRYEEGANKKCEKVKQTLLYRIIQSHDIIMQHDYGEMIWHTLMQERRLLLNACSFTLASLATSGKCTMETQ